jgi:hypothetical protein
VELIITDPPVDCLKPEPRQRPLAMEAIVLAFASVVVPIREPAVVVAVVVVVLAVAGVVAVVVSAEKNGGGE